MKGATEVGLDWVEFVMNGARHISCYQGVYSLGRDVNQITPVMCDSKLV